jgi:crystallin alpha B
MSLHPFGYWVESRDRPIRLFDQHFGSQLLDDDLVFPSLGMFHRAPHAITSTLRPRHIIPRERSGVSEVKYDKDKFQVMLDVQQFKPEEIDVKTIDKYVLL